MQLAQEGPVTDCCEYGDEPAGSGATDLLSYSSHGP
jgi:hypothetical protein